MKRNLLLLLSVILLAALVTVAARYYFSRPQKMMLMGTLVSVRGDNAALAFAEILRVENLLSKFNPSSEVSLINQNAGLATVLVSKDTFKVISLAQEIAGASQGAFDITLGKNGSYRDVILDKARGKIGLKRKGMALDPGGIGKGYAVEQARKVLLSSGTLKALIDMHSSIAAIGGPWKIGIKDPRKKRGVIGGIVLQDGEALSTSANYEQPGHLIDPRNGRPADRCLSVTVIALNAALADALSTAIFVLGPQAGIILAKEYKVKYCIVDKEGKIYDNLGAKLR